MIENNSTNTILIPYDCIVDEDTGLLRVIRDKYSNDTVFYMDKIETDDDVQNLVLNEKYNNPLELILKPDYIEKTEDFYNQFMTEEYENILIASFITKIFEFAKLMIINKLSDIVFLADNEKQKDSLRKIFGNEVNIMVGSISKAIKLEDFDIVFLKRVERIVELEPLQGINIYILDYNFNFENTRDSKDPLPKIEYSIFAVQHHYVAHLIDPYVMEEELVEENEEETIEYIDEKEEIENYDDF